MLLKLALRNILGAGLRTWLNVIVLSFSFVVIIWSQGFYSGMNEFAMREMVNAEIGGGQYWWKTYDPFDPLTLKDAHGKITKELNEVIDQKKAAAILVTNGSIYPNGRLKSIMIKGINRDQESIAIPTQHFENESGVISAIIGNRMSKSTGLKKGDYVTMRWRDKDGTFDAAEIKISLVMNTSVQSVDINQVWLPLDVLQKMMDMENEATIITVSQDQEMISANDGWIVQSQDDLLKDLRDMVNSKRIGASIMYVMLLLLAMLAIFDTQILSIFRRKKEMGTLMALGLIRRKVIQLFTLEGVFHGVLAALVAGVYGIPLIVYTSKVGFDLPDSFDSYGFAIGQKLLPVYSAGLIIGTVLLVLTVTTIVSYMPTRRISKLKPTDALRGK